MAWLEFVVKGLVKADDPDKGNEILADCFVDHCSTVKVFNIESSNIVEVPHEKK